MSGPGGAKPRNWTKLPVSVVKSAGRVLQILEYFDDVQRDATVVEVAQALGYPQSSASTLLRSLVTLGYLHYSSAGRSYRPTTRVRLLGSWINPPLFEEAKILRLVSDLNAATGETIVLAVRNGLHAQYIHVAQATTSLRLHLTPGTLRPLAASGAGWVLLSTVPAGEVAKLVRRINAEAPPGTPKVDVAELQARLDDIRARGHAFSNSTVTPGGAILAMLLPSELSESPLVIGIGGASERMVPKEAELAAAMRQTIARHLAEMGRGD